MQTPMRAIPVALFVIALSGCTDGTARPDSPPASADPDGVACEDSAGAPAVRIEIEYSDGAIGTPSEECEVDDETMLTWRGPVRGGGFQLRFHDQSPAGAGAPMEVASRPHADGRHRIQMSADNASGRYEYDIISDGVVVDPAIIIR